MSQKGKEDVKKKKKKTENQVTFGVSMHNLLSRAEEIERARKKKFGWGNEKMRKCCYKFMFVIEKQSEGESEKERESQHNFDYHEYIKTKQSLKC